MAKRRSYGEGSIYRQSNGLWRGTVELGWENGKRKRKVVAGKTKAAVVRKVNLLSAQIMQGMMPGDGRTTVGQLLTHWLEHTAKPNVRYSTWRGYEQNVRLYLMPNLGRIRLVNLTPSDVEKMMSTMRKDGLSPRTIQYAHATLRLALKKALRDGLVHQNVATLVSPPKVVKKPLQPLSEAEAKQLMAAAVGDPLEALFVVALGMGLRRGELCGLKWEDLNTKDQTLTVSRALQHQGERGLVEVPPKSETSIRTLPVPGFVAAILRAHKHRQREHQIGMGPRWRGGDYIFTMEDGRPVAPDYVNLAFGRLLKRADIRRIRFHDLRHSCASFLFAQGCEMRLVMEILGHSQISLTANTYTHLLAEAKRPAAEAMDSIFGSSF